MTEKELLIYLNGDFVRESEAKVSVFDRCFLYGDGIFEGITVWKGVPFRLDAHLQRMYKGCPISKLKTLSPMKNGKRRSWR
jgi:branched-subunit amino acid aminotransferase/4-amino-4-deoxychorismate lyase